MTEHRFPTADALAAAIPSCWPELAEIFGNDWPEVERQLWHLLGRLEAGDEEATQSIVELLVTDARVEALLDAALDRSLGIEKGGQPTGTTSMGRHVIVPVLYGTDRRRTNNGYANEAGDGSLSYGLAEVSIPEDHRMGVLERPPWWRFGFGWNPDEHVQLLSITRLERDDFVDQVRSLANEAERREALVFIHGFNVDFHAAALRTAQIAYDLEFSGLAALYSWPSQGRANQAGYIADRDKVRWTEPHLRDFLQMLLTEFGLDAVHLVAHSMGNSALTEVIRDLDVGDLPPESARLSQLVFAAPDVNQDTFADLAKQFAAKADRCTLYASSGDKALRISQRWNASKRAGDAGGLLQVVPGVDTIDASSVATSLVGHSYYGSNESVISDMIELLADKEPNERARLVRRGPPRMPFWVFKDPTD